MAPLWSTGFGVEVAAQQAAAVALGAALLLIDAGPRALAAAALAVALVGWRPDGAWELAALGLTPAAVGSLAAVWRRPAVRDRLLAAVAAATLILAGLGLAQRLGAPLFVAAMRAVAGERAAATATLGNPNHLAAYLAIAAALLLGWRPAGALARGVRLGAIVGAVAAIVATGSFLGLVALAVGGTAAIVATVGRGRIAAAVIAIALAAMAALVVAVPAARAALAGRGYLARVQLAGLDARGWIHGLGPGRFDAAFLDDQAAWLAGHPDDERHWTNPGFPHADPVGVLRLGGLLGLIAIAVAARRGLRWQPAIAPPAAAAALATTAAVALGSTVIWMPGVLGIGWLAVTSALAPRPPRAAIADPPTAARVDDRPRRARRTVAVVIALAWIAVLAGAWIADGLRGRALAYATAGQLDRARIEIERAGWLPFGAARRDLVHGRILLEGGQAGAALAPLERAAAALPHPAVLDALLAAEARALGAPRPATLARRRFIRSP